MGQGCQHRRKIGFGAAGGEIRQNCIRIKAQRPGEGAQGQALDLVCGGRMRPGRKLRDYTARQERRR